MLKFAILTAEYLESLDAFQSLLRVQECFAMRIVRSLRKNNLHGVLHLQTLKFKFIQLESFEWGLAI